MARVLWIELPDEWGPRQELITFMEAGGYTVEKRVMMATGEARLFVTCESPGAGRGFVDSSPI